MQVPDTHIIRCASGRQELGGTTKTDAVERLLSKLLQKVEGLESELRAGRESRNEGVFDDLRGFEDRL